MSREPPCPLRSADPPSPWSFGHNLILGHAHVVDLYRKTYKPTQNGVIGITLSGDWGEPIDSSANADFMARKRMEYVFGQFANPICESVGEF